MSDVGINFKLFENFFNMKVKQLLNKPLTLVGKSSMIPLQA